MNYINAEEFFTQSEAMRKVFINWFDKNKEIYDLYFIPKTDEDNNILINELKWTDYYILEDLKKNNLYPALNETQLRTFIEDKSDGIVKVIQWHISDNDISNKGYSIDILRRNEYHVIYHYRNLGEDLIRAYWQVACKIAQEVAELEEITELVQERQKNDDGTRYTTEDIKKLRRKRGE